MTYALKAAEALAGDGIEAEVIDLRTLRPLDMETVIRSVKKTGRCVTVEEAGRRTRWVRPLRPGLCRRLSISSTRRSSM
jgi:pyruvate/2-oxoglutarate/acetoin dehydrogenase E1 component